MFSVEGIVNLLILDSFPPQARDFSLLVLLVKRQIPLTWRCLHERFQLQLDLLLSMKHKGFLKAWQPVPVKNNWYGLTKRVSLFQRALEWTF